MADAMPPALARTPHRENTMKIWMAAGALLAAAIVTTPRAAAQTGAAVSPAPLLVGTWALNKDLSDNAAEGMGRDGERRGANGGGGGRRGGRGGGFGGGG